VGYDNGMIMVNIMKEDLLFPTDNTVNKIVAIEKRVKSCGNEIITLLLKDTK